MGADLRVVAVNTPPLEPADQLDAHSSILLRQIVTVTIDRSNLS
jgi:hypothetical protein